MSVSSPSAALLSNNPGRRLVLCAYRLCRSRPRESTPRRIGRVLDAKIHRRSSQNRMRCLTNNAFHLDAALARQWSARRVLFFDGADGVTPPRRSRPAVRLLGPCVVLKLSALARCARRRSDPRLRATMADADIMPTTANMKMTCASTVSCLKAFDIIVTA